MHFPLRSNVLHSFMRRMASAALLAVLAIGAPDALAAGHSLRFSGAGAADVDRVKIRIDDPLTALPGPPADVGATDFTLELWLMGSAAQNAAPAVTCGANQAWTAGNVVVDRDRFGADRKYGIALAGGKVVFGVSGNGTGNLTLCSISSVLDNAWHHIAVQRRLSDGNLWLFVDGNLEAQAVGPGGDISYPDAAPAVQAEPIRISSSAPRNTIRDSRSPAGSTSCGSRPSCATRRISHGRGRRSSPTVSPPRSTISTTATARRCTTARVPQAARAPARSSAAARRTDRRGCPTTRSTSAVS